VYFLFKRGAFDVHGAFDVQHHPCNPTLAAVVNPLFQFIICITICLTYEQVYRSETICDIRAKY